jgi:toxin ParE1/3/4
VTTVRFHAEAEVELTAEISFYEERSPGLGKRFAREVQAAVQLASVFPRIGTRFKFGTRRVFPKKFPFSIVYQETSSGIVVLAIAPFLRRPAYWRGRKSGA